jgi:hypothetical protein
VAAVPLDQRVRGGDLPGRAYGIDVETVAELAGGRAEQDRLECGPRASNRDPRHARAIDGHLLDGHAVHLHDVQRDPRASEAKAADASAAFAIEAECGIAVDARAVRAGSVD